MGWKKGAHLVVQLDGGIEALVLHLVVNQMVPADLDLGVTAGHASHQEGLVKAALLKSLADMLGDVVGILEVFEVFLDDPFKLLLILLFTQRIPFDISS